MITEQLNYISVNEPERKIFSDKFLIRLLNSSECTIIDMEQLFDHLRQSTITGNEYSLLR
jgi:hypothetical protein